MPDPELGVPSLAFADKVLGELVKNGERLPSPFDEGAVRPNSVLLAAVLPALPAFDPSELELLSMRHKRDLQSLVESKPFTPGKPAHSFEFSAEHSLVNVGVLWKRTDEALYNLSFVVTSTLESEAPDTPLCFALQDLRGYLVADGLPAVPLTCERPDLLVARGLRGGENYRVFLL